MDLELSNEDWAIIYTLHNDLTRDTNVQNLQFKITHTIMTCGYNLKIWKIKSIDVCEKCNEFVDTIKHHMIFCQAVKQFWNQVLKWWTNCMKVIFRLDSYEILFRILNKD